MPARGLADLLAGHYGSARDFTTELPNGRCETSTAYLVFVIVAAAAFAVAGGSAWRENREAMRIAYRAEAASLAAGRHVEGYPCAPRPKRYLQLLWLLGAYGCLPVGALVGEAWHEAMHRNPGVSNARTPPGSNPLSKVRHSILLVREHYYYKINLLDAARPFATWIFTGGFACVIGGAVLLFWAASALNLGPGGPAAAKEDVQGLHRPLETPPMAVIGGLLVGVLAALFFATPNAAFVSQRFHKGYYSKAPLTYAVWTPGYQSPAVLLSLVAGATAFYAIKLAWLVVGVFTAAAAGAARAAAKPDESLESVVSRRHRTAYALADAGVSMVAWWGRRNGPRHHILGEPSKPRYSRAEWALCLSAVLVAGRLACPALALTAAFAAPERWAMLMAERTYHLSTSGRPNRLLAFHCGYVDWSILLSFSVPVKAPAGAGASTWMSVDADGSGVSYYSGHGRPRRRRRVILEYMATVNRVNTTLFSPLRIVRKPVGYAHLFDVLPYWAECAWSATKSVAWGVKWLFTDGLLGALRLIADHPREIGLVIDAISRGR